MMATRFRIAALRTCGCVRPLATSVRKTAPKADLTPEDMRRMTLRSVGLFAISGLAFAGYFLYERQRAAAQREAARADGGVGAPRIGGPFVLVDHFGRPVCDEDLRGRFVLMYFGYTFCPDVCPEELDKMAQIVDALKANSDGSADLLPVFVSCDPKRDSVQSIREYLAEFHPSFLGLTGTHNQIRRIAKAFRMYYSAPPKAVDDDEVDYLVDHSIFFYLLGPDGKYISHYGRTDAAPTVARKIADVMRQHAAKNKSGFFL